MSISYKHECLFIEIPRTNGLSWRSMLSIKENDIINETDWMIIHGQSGLSHIHPRVFDKSHFLMMHIMQIKLINKLVFDSFFKFTFVRNPWDRLASQYFNHYNEYYSEFELFINKIIEPVEYINDNFVFDVNDSFYEDYSRIVYNTLFNIDIDKPYEPRLDPNALRTGARAMFLDDHGKYRYQEGRLDINTNIDYDYFVHFIPSFIPQHLYVYNASSNLLVNFVGRFENYLKDATYILDHLNIDTEVFNINQYKWINSIANKKLASEFEKSNDDYNKNGFYSPPQKCLVFYSALTSHDPI